MGRSVVERPMKEIADFIENPASVLIYDKHIKVCLIHNHAYIMYSYMK